MEVIKVLAGDFLFGSLKIDLTFNWAAKLKQYFVESAQQLSQL